METLPSPFPPFVAFVALASDRLQGAILHPDEAALVQSARSEKRLREFTLGRLAARSALEKLGLDPAPPVLRGPDREPLWPAGIVGSLTHCGDRAVAAAARIGDCSAIGIDLESLDRRPAPGIAGQIAAGPEIEWLNQAGEGFQTRLLMMFSAKESLYKALFPLCGRYFGFKDACATWRPESAAFEMTLLEDLSDNLKRGSTFQSGCRIHDRTVLSYTILKT